jgi:hypothetical protein
MFATGCAVGVQSDYAPNVNLDKYQTYAWMPAPDSASASNMTLNSSLMREVNEEMYQRGFRLDTANPDVVLVLHTMLETKTEVIERPIYSSYSYYRPGFYSGFPHDFYGRYYDPFYGYYWPGYVSMPEVVGYDIETVQYKEGNFVIDMIDRRSKHIVWRGWSENALKAKLLDDADDLVEKLFNKRFPVEEKENDGNMEASR